MKPEIRGISTFGSIRGKKDQSEREQNQKMWYKNFNKQQSTTNVRKIKYLVDSTFEELLEISLRDDPFQ